ncbi:SprT-like domain-containing protein [Rhodocaloribacter sp.]
MADRARKLEEVAAGVRRLMDELGRAHLGEPLQARGWTFTFDRARRRVGCCTWKVGETRVRRLSLSRHFALRLTWDELEDTVRHEIAHALDYETRGRSGHDAVWKDWARRCGANPERLHENVSVDPSGALYLGVCPSCGAEYPFFRRPRYARACGTCCEQKNGGRYSEAFRLILYDRVTGEEIA